MADRDVIVAGGGPAGAAAATVLAGAGARVAVLDKARFPRPKLCAGLLTWKTLKTIERVFGTTAAQLEALGVINHKSSRYRIRHRETVLSEGQLVYPFHFVDRRVFDAWCLDRAAAAGAEVLQGLGVVSADPVSGVVGASDGSAWTARHLVGADGANSTVRRCCGIDEARFGREQGMGLELYLDRSALAGIPGLHEDVAADFPTIASGFIDAGYCWSFPHRDVVVLGICGLYRGRPAGMISRCFTDFLDFLNVPQALRQNVKGHPLPYGNWLERPLAGRALLAGDAGGLVEPFFGEGIHYALRTGEMAARACLGGLRGAGEPGAAYQADLEREIFPELVWSKRLRTALYWLTRLGILGPVRLFLGGGGTKLQEMVHGMRSFRLCKPLDCHGPWR
ncbi:Menaquinone reductase [Fundidesulfovibrio magnetotacticus]|uniref:Menaquinone reductase n=1 Tax=Fundidesulfovibrio magnetotacticus TaxID=2730080 RepID=A0A6V8LLR7_9BACT|nr:NAD(P)/FAD-dependent oxidoreductase [Fundidesulfovibrio magnetotacticus]GFK93633.1 Menaquinone reductase [Fundidesulfovibrio magnetotacticus]